MIKYKLTTQDTIWVPGETHTIIVPGNTLYSNQVFHGYHSPEQAVLFNPLYSDIASPKLWEVEIDAVWADDSLTFGCKKMTLIRELPLPTFTTEQRVAFAIYCAESFADDAWLEWADNWINGKDRSVMAARAAARAAWTEARAARAEVAARAARAAAEAARVARVAARVARVAAWAARAAAWTARPIDFQSFIQRAMEVSK